MQLLRMRAIITIVLLSGALYACTNMNLLISNAMPHKRFNVLVQVMLSNTNNTLYFYNDLQSMTLCISVYIHSTSYYTVKTI